MEALKAEIDPYLGGTQGWRKRGHSKESGKGLSEFCEHRKEFQRFLDNMQEGRGRKISCQIKIMRAREI